MQKIVLIPSYEPDNNIIELIKNLSKEDVSIVIVNDGSGKDYDEIFNEIKTKAHIIAYRQNKGKGYALKTGLRYIKESFKNEYVVVTMDSDGQHKIEDALKLCEYIEKNPKNLALGKRLRSKVTPLRSKLGNGITKVAYSLSTGISIYDTQTGLRAFSNYLIDTMIKIDGDRYEYEMNVLLILSRIGVEIKEIEIETIYIDNNSNSHFNTVKDAFRIYKQIIKFSLSSISSFFIDYILYSILVILTKNIIISNIIARAFSGTINYSINKKMVFNSKTKVYKSFTQYIVLAVIVLTLNTVILNIFVNNLNANPYIAKVVVEIILFLFSWSVQKKIIFNQKGDKGKCLKRKALE